MGGKYAQLGMSLGVNWVGLGVVCRGPKAVHCDPSCVCASNVSFAHYLNVTGYTAFGGYSRPIRADILSLSCGKKPFIAYSKAAICSVPYLFDFTVPKNQCLAPSKIPMLGCGPSHVAQFMTA